MSRILYLKDLIEHGACEASTRLFEKMFGDHVDVTVELAVSMSSVFDIHVCPALRELLSEEGLKEYKNIAEPAYAEYKKIADPTWAEYKKTIATAWAEYTKIADPAWAEYTKIADSAYEEYKKIVNPAWAEYEKTVATAWATAYIRENLLDQNNQNDR